MRMLFTFITCCSMALFTIGCCGDQCKILEAEHDHVHSHDDGTAHSHPHVHDGEHDHEHD